MDLSDYARKTGVKPAEFQEKLAAHGLDVSREIVRRWLSGAQSPGAKSWAAIEAATNNKVRRQHMRPDIFGAAA